MATTIRGVRFPGSTLSAILLWGQKSRETEWRQIGWDTVPPRLYCSAQPPNTLSQIFGLDIVRAAVYDIDADRVLLGVVLNAIVLPVAGRVI